MQTTPPLVLMAQAGELLCAFQVQSVLEVMRPLSTTPISGQPGFMRGVSVVRGLPTPVVDLAALIGGVPSPAPTRFVLLRVGDPALPQGRQVALTADGVPGLRSLPASLHGTLVPLLSRAEASAVQTLTTLDSRLLAVLDTARLIPPEAWAGIGGAA